MKAALALNCARAAFWLCSLQSYSAPPIEQVEIYVETNGYSEFLKAVDGRKADNVWKLIDELVEAVKILHPRMYTTFIDKVQDI